MDTVRIAALLTHFLDRPLNQSQLDQISIYIDLLLRWNARINLTAIRQEDEIVSRHFGESLFLARHLFPPEFPTDAPKSDPARTPEGAPSKLRLGGHVRVTDIGSGAGFPAIPLKIWAQEIHLTLIESNHKKAVFLNEVARALTLTNINVINERTEALTARLSCQADVVTLRAVERFETILPQAESFLAPQGTLALLTTTAQLPIVNTLTHLTWRQIKVPESNTRLLSIGSNP
jgi:16S rRNA (guanine527-N7)-methyltransferase